MMRVAIYARYSSDQQRDASIEDQLRVCRARADREGWLVVDTYTDHATSGATTLRAGYQALLAALRGGSIDVVLAESLDRFSRDLEHIAAFFKQCVFHKVRIHTLAEGDISELHIGLKGTMGALYLKDLAEKTRRGLAGRIHAGRCIGSPPYGYTVVRKLKDDGELDRGLRAIDPEQAAVVRRIFEAYAGGASPRRIARTLNAEAIPGPRSGVWFNSSIRGRAMRSDGLLRNELYIGRLVWRRRINVKDPISGARVRHDNRPVDHLVIEVPHLRIIDDELWQRVQTRLKRDAAPVHEGPDGTRPAFWVRRRPRHLLSGKAFCGVCGRPLSLFGRDYMGCKAASHGTCRNRRTIRRAVLQDRVMDALRRQLMQPGLVEEFIAAFNHEWRRLAGEAKARAAGHQRERVALDRKIANLIEAISDGRSSPAIIAKLAELEATKAGLGNLPSPAAAPAPALHPSISQVYAAKVRNLEAGLANRADVEVLEAARSLIDKVILHPSEIDGDPPCVELVGDLMALLRAAGVKEPPSGSLTADVLGVFVSSVKAAPGACR